MRSNRSVPTGTFPCRERDWPSFASQPVLPATLRFVANAPSMRRSSARIMKCRAGWSLQRDLGQLAPTITSRPSATQSRSRRVARPFASRRSPRPRTTHQAFPRSRRLCSRQVGGTRAPPQPIQPPTWRANAPTLPTQQNTTNASATSQRALNHLTATSRGSMAQGGAPPAASRACGDEPPACDQQGRTPDSHRQRTVPPTRRRPGAAADPRSHAMGHLDSAASFSALVPVSGPQAGGN
jgi:hypothetical protein